MDFITTDNDDVVDAGGLFLNLDGGAGFDRLILDYSGPIQTGPETFVTATSVALRLDADGSGFNGDDIVNFINDAERAGNFGRGVHFNGFEEFDITATDGADQITTGDGDDIIRGLGGDDTIRAGEGRNEIYAGDGNDDIRGERSSVNILDAGDGDDYITSYTSADTIRGGTGWDRLQLYHSDAESGLTISLSDGVGVLSGIELISGRLTEHDDVVDAGGLFLNLDGGAGFDRLILDYSGPIQTGPETFVTATSVALRLDADGSGFNGDDIVNFINDAERAGNFGRGVHFNGFEEFDITATDGADQITTGDGDDIIRGLGGDDTIRAGEGDDIIVIGVSGGNDTVVNFEVGIDAINVAEFSKLNIIEALARYQSGETASLVLSDTTSITFSGIDIQTLSLSDFDFTELEVAPRNLRAPNSLFLEYLARIEAYRAGQGADYENPIQIDEVIENANGQSTGYSVDQIFRDPGGFVAIGLTSETGEPILVIRGTNSAADILADFDSEGVGFGQFEAAWNATDGVLKNWVKTQSEFGLHVVGHSLGGTQAQLLTAYATSLDNNFAIRTLTTFNATGISGTSRDLAQLELVGSVEHRISSGDVVSIAGNVFLGGAVEVYDVNVVTNPLAYYLYSLVSHVQHWSRADHYGSAFDHPDAYAEFGVRWEIESLGSLTTGELSSPVYSPVYSNNGIDAEYFGYLVLLNTIPFIGPTVSHALMFRSTAENKRELIGKGLDLLGTVVDLAPFLQIVGEATLTIASWGLEKIEPLKNWTIDTFKGIQNLSAESWQAWALLANDTIAAISSWTSDTWQLVSNWTADSWEGVKDWSASLWAEASQWRADAWDSLGDWTASHWMAVKDITEDNFDALMNLSEDVLDKIVKRGAPLLRKIQIELAEGIEAITDALIESILGNTFIRGGTDLIDRIIGDGISEFFSLGLGDDQLSPGGGFDDAELGAGADSITGTAAELNGLRVLDFTNEDTLTILGVGLSRDTFTYTRGSAILDIDTDGDGIVDTTIKLEGSISFDEIIIEIVDGSTVISLQNSTNGINQLGTKDSDVIQGSSGNDIIEGLSGADVLDGGLGVDLLSYSASTAAVTVNLNGFASGGHAEGDTLNDFENLIGSLFDDQLFGTALENEISGNAGNDQIFGDISAAADLSPASIEAQVYRAYVAVLGRAPDAAGYAANVTNILFGVQSQTDLVTSFVNSVEFGLTYGDLSTTAFVETLFTNVLPNNQDAAARAAFANRIDNDDTYSRIDMVIEFTNTPEFVAAQALPSAAFASGVLDVHPDEASVFRAYQAVFNRAPDAAGFTANVDALQGDAISLAAITASFVASAEFDLTYGNLNTVDFVETLYTNVLPGNSDQAGRAAFAARLDDTNQTYTRADMVFDFVTSPEFVSQQADAAAAFVATVYTDANDTLTGGTGDDVLFGGRGEDIFVYDVTTDGNDTVLDFELGTDMLTLTGREDFDSFGEIMSAGTQVGNATVFDFGSGNTLTLDNVTLSALTASDFGLEATQSAEKASAIPVAEVQDLEVILPTGEEPDWVIDALI